MNMLRLAVYLVLAAALAITGAWLADNPGQVSLAWQDWRIDTTASFLLVISLALAFIFYALLGLIRSALKTPRQWQRSRIIRQDRLGLQALTNGLVALAAADLPAARRAAGKAERYLGKTPVTLLLSAQIARQEGDDANMRATMEEMLSYKETRFLAARSLSEFHTRREEPEKALAFAERAHENNPDQTDALRLVAGNHVRIGQWQEALNAIDRSRFHIPRRDRRRLKGYVYFARADALAREQEAAMAATFARYAQKHLQPFAPAARLYANLLERTNQLKAARKIRAKIPPQDELSSWLCGDCGHHDAKWHPFCPRCHAFGRMQEEKS